MDSRASRGTGGSSPSFLRSGGFRQKLYLLSTAKAVVRHVGRTATLTWQCSAPPGANQRHFNLTSRHRFRARPTRDGDAVPSPGSQPGFARRPSKLPNGNSSDDNRDDSGPFNYAPTAPICTYSPWSRLLPAPGSMGSKEGARSRVAGSERSASWLVWEQI